MLGIIGVDAILLAIALSLDKDKHFLFRLLTYFFVNFSFVIVSKFIIDWSSGQAYEGTALIFHKFVLGWITIFGIYPSSMPLGKVIKQPLYMEPMYTQRILNEH